MAGRVLIADNAATNRIILKVKLSVSRYDVVQAEDVDSLLAAARAHQPDLIIVDLDLPGGGIDAVCRGLGEARDLAGIPVIGIASVDDRQARLAGLRAGADEVLSKPMDEVALLALVRNLIRSRTALCELERKQAVAQEFGFAEAAPRFTRLPRIALVPGSREAGFGWRAGLVDKVRGRISVLDKAQALGNEPPDGAADAFVISATLVEEGDGLRLISELRSHPATRHAVIVLHVPSADGAITTMGLDMGANAVMSGAFDAEYLALRLGRLVAQKLAADALRSARDQQLSLAMTDPLTGLYNRRYAQSYLNRILRRAQQKAMPFTLMLLDLDRFKQVNDRFGHAVGDEVLVEVGRRLSTNLREEDLLARFGGEEFLIVLPDTGREEAARVAERLRRVVGDVPVRARSRHAQVPVTLSIGVVVSSEIGTSAQRIDKMIDHADRALYASKAEGRNQITFVRTAA